MKRASAAAVAALVAASCATPLMKLPSGPGEPARDAAPDLANATSRCRSVMTFTAEVAVSGSVGGRRVPRVRLLTGVAAPASARLEAVAPFGAPLFVFVAQGDEATLLLRDRRILEHAAPAEVLESLTGVPLGAADLRTTITGCASRAESSRARTLEDGWVVVPEGADRHYLRRDSGSQSWRLVASLHQSDAGGEWRAEYSNFEGGLPRTIRLARLGERRFDLRLALSQVDVNVPLDADAFRVRIPPGTQPISLDELRQAGPLADVTHGR